MNRFIPATAAATLLVGIAAAGTPTEARIVSNGWDLNGMSMQGTQMQGTSRAGAVEAAGNGAGFDFTAVKLSGVALPDQGRVPRVKHEEAAE